VQKPEEGSSRGGGCPCIERDGDGLLILVSHQVYLSITGLDDSLRRFATAVAAGEEKIIPHIMSAAVQMESPATYPESPTEGEDIYPCKGCGEVLYTESEQEVMYANFDMSQILEEGKAFELGG
jgi:hypothetical protein